MFYVYHPTNSFSGLSYRSVLEHLLKGFHLSPQLPDDLGIGVLVDHGVVDDLLGPVGVPQRGQGLLEVVPSRGNRCHHHGPAVAAQVVLEWVRY